MLPQQVGPLDPAEQAVGPLLVCTSTSCTATLTPWRAKLVLPVSAQTISVAARRSASVRSAAGTRIAFVSDRGAADSGGSYDIYLKSVQGGGVVRVMATAEREQFPRWRPR